MTGVLAAPPEAGQGGYGGQVEPGGRQHLVEHVERLAPDGVRVLGRVPLPGRVGPHREPRHGVQHFAQVGRHLGQRGPHPAVRLLGAVAEPQRPVGGVLPVVGKFRHALGRHRREHRVGRRGEPAEEREPPAGERQQPHDAEGEVGVGQFRQPHIAEVGGVPSVGVRVLAAPAAVDLAAAGIQ